MSASSRLLLLLLPVALGACKKESAGPAEGECAVATDCPDGKQCVDSHCIQVDCTSSAECPFNSYCDTQSYACVDGCRDDGDCLAGYACDETARTCLEETCTETELDCEIGQICNQGSGQCQDDTRDHCGACDILNSNPNQCPGGQCYYFAGDSCQSTADCDEGYVCESIPGIGKICHADYCFMSCSPAAEDSCPRGFQCIDGSGMGDFVCFADCNFLVTEGLL